MTLIQQQRLLGAVLLVCLIGVIAWFLLDKVEQNQPQPQQEEPITFDSVIEPIAEQGEVVEMPEEKLVDPHGLEQQATKPEPEIVASEAVTTETAAEKQPEPAEQPPLQEPATVAKPEPTPQTVTETPTAPTPTANAEPMWVLQLASFSVRENADSLAKQLKDMGYKPMIESTSNAGTQIYRVRLQPVADRAKLEQTAQTLNKKLKLNTQILQHQP